MTQHVFELPMRWADLDSLNHVNNVVYLDYAAEARGLLIDDGVLDAGLAVSSTSVRYSVPMSLSRHPAIVTSELDGATLTQQVCSDHGGLRTVHCTVTTTFGALTSASRTPDDSPALPARIRRSDLDTTGLVTEAKTFELFQEGRVLFIADHLTGFKAGQFVVGTVIIDFHATIAWRQEPYESRSRISRVGAGSVTIESELSDGDTLLARGQSVLVGFDLASQKARPFSPGEIGVFEGLKALN